MHEFTRCFGHSYILKTTLHSIRPDQKRRLSLSRNPKSHRHARRSRPPFTTAIAPSLAATVAGRNCRWLGLSSRESQRSRAEPRRLGKTETGRPAATTYRRGHHRFQVAETAIDDPRCETQPLNLSQVTTATERLALRHPQAGLPAGRPFRPPERLAAA
ncbi:hypothetical protein CRG98_044815 [Punica granatum]|uniref:Uncharacterized protein n=1 Tax=Punica granatum TaxID=22663 RepID=A0A2I0HSW4_PUNGR|nr:hypothetical protein CRG98_044815 [Punica granatum]